MSITTNDRIIANRGCSMKVIDEFLNNKQEQGQLAISLCGKLEGIVGNYFVSQVTHGIFEGLWYSVYSDPSVDYLKEAIKRDRNLIGYVDKYIRWAFILENRSQKFKEDTAEYGLTYIEVPSFEQEILQCHHPDDLPFEFADILWIDDDFLNDDTLPFDFDLFARIDAGESYLNPKHFSVNQFVSSTQKRMGEKL